MNYEWSLRWRLQLRRKVEREKGIPNWMWCIHFPSMSRWRAALYFDITINVSDFFVMFLRFTAAEGDGVRKEITLNTTDYNFSILGGIRVSLEAMKHNIRFHLLLSAAPIFSPCKGFRSAREGCNGNPAITVAFFWRLCRWLMTIYRFCPWLDWTTFIMNKIWTKLSG